MNPRGQRTCALAIHVSHKDGTNTRVVRYPLARTIPDVIVNDSPHAQIASRAALVREEPKVTDVLVANGQRARGRRQRGDGHNNKSGIHDGRSEKKKKRPLYEDERKRKFLCVAENLARVLLCFNVRTYGEG